MPKQVQESVAWDKKLNLKTKLIIRWQSEHQNCKGRSWENCDIWQEKPGLKSLVLCPWWALIRYPSIILNTPISRPFFQKIMQLNPKILTIYIWPLVEVTLNTVKRSKLGSSWCPGLEIVKFAIEFHLLSCVWKLSFPLVNLHSVSIQVTSTLDITLFYLNKIQTVGLVILCFMSIRIPPPFWFPVFVTWTVRSYTCDRHVIQTTPLPGQIILS